MADGSQVGMVLLLVGLAVAVVALFQATILAGRMKPGLLRVSVRTVAVLLLLVSLPAGWLLVFLAAFATVNEYRPLEVAGYSVVVRTLSWHHRSYSILEGEGLLFHTVVTCGEGVLMDANDPFATGDYDVVRRGGHDVLRFTVDGPSPHEVVSILDLHPHDDVRAVCAAAAA
ncbi:hypothetical protein [Leifsonia sp. LS-T14]|uniref:hypothetical protein n=1 Tax=unclassified Leifsonia TaxID=2663824 RepID=UPI0035A68FE5